MQHHNSELSLGVATVLVNQILSSNTATTTSSSGNKIVGQQQNEEIRMLVAALEMVSRASSPSLQVALEAWPSHSLPRLVQLLETHESKIVSNSRGNVYNSIPHGDITSLNLLKIFVSLAKVPQVRPLLLETPGMWGILQRLVPEKNPPSHRNANAANNNSSSKHHKMLRLKLLHQLSQSSQNQLPILQKLTPQILHICHDGNDAAGRQYAASILMELASSSADTGDSNATTASAATSPDDKSGNNKTTAATKSRTANELMAHNDQILGTLVKLCLTDPQATTRESVLTALQNLAFGHGNRLHLATYKKGIVLQALCKALTTDVSPKARRRAAGALTNLACDGTAQVLGNHHGLLDALAVASTTSTTSMAASSTTNNSKDAVVDEVQTRASLALTKIAGSISITMECFPAVLDALVVASLSPSAGNVAAILRLKARLPENRSFLARHHGILDTLADLCYGPHKHHAVRALMHMANDNSNHEILGLQNPAVLDALVHAAAGKVAKALRHPLSPTSTEVHPDDDARDCAIVALERLAVSAHLRPHLAVHPRLLTVVAQAVEREAQLQHEYDHDDDRHGASKQQQQHFLAKPLLLSLLVAM